MQAIANPPVYERAGAAVRYDDVAPTLVHALKYGDRLDLAPTLGRWMVQAGGALLADAARRRAPTSRIAGSCSSMMC